MAREVRIFCPKCQWEPRPADRWLCSSCGCVWNTFDTGGVCPGCGKAWSETMCLSCHKWSPHAEWYHQFGEDPCEEVEVVEETVVKEMGAAKIRLCPAQNFEAWIFTD